MNNLSKNSLFSGYRPSIVGVSMGLLLFAASMTPSLIPRSDIVQGILGGTVMAIGYLIAVILIGIWRFLQFPKLNKKHLALLNLLVLFGSGTVFTLTLLNLRHSQNELRVLMTMSPLSSSHELIVVAIGFMLYVSLLIIGRLITFSTYFLRNKLSNRIPPRLSLVISLMLMAVVSWNLGNGLIASRLLTAADNTYREIDAIIDPDLPVPKDTLKTGSNESLISWDTLGAQGRRFIAGGLSIEQIKKFHTNYDVLQPIRVYAGLNSGETIQQRAELVLGEMKRVGAFERTYLLVVTPTGTGWIDPAAVAPFEMMHKGDTAIVGIQYSYLMSPMALLFEPGLAQESSRNLFTTIHKYWKTLPVETRPKLLLHGLSLGSYGAENALSLFEMIENPIDGILWSGPTFGNPIWRYLTQNRNSGSSVWFPKVGDGQLVRYITQETMPSELSRMTSQMPIVYLQYASDPITFYEASTALRAPVWMIGQRAPDVLENLTWYPLVTMLQLTVDMLICTYVPKGFGHVFSEEDYINAWILLTNPTDWSHDDTLRLKYYFRLNQ